MANNAYSNIFKIVGIQRGTVPQSAYSCNRRGSHGGSNYELDVHRALDREDDGQDGPLPPRGIVVSQLPFTLFGRDLTSFVVGVLRKRILLLPTRLDRPYLLGIRHVRGDGLLFVGIRGLGVV